MSESYRIADREMTPERAKKALELRDVGLSWLEVKEWLDIKLKVSSLASYCHRYKTGKGLQIGARLPKKRHTFANEVEDRDWSLLVRRWY